MRYKLTFTGGIKVHDGTIDLPTATMTVLKHAPHRPIFIRSADRLMWPYVLRVGPAGVTMFREEHIVDNVHPDFAPLANAVRRSLTTTGAPA